MTANHSAIREAYLRDPSALTVQLARQFGVPEVEVLRSMPAEQVVELDSSRWEQLIRHFELLGMVHVIASNASVTLEAFGQFGNFSTWGDFFNVQTKSLDMHIRHKQLAAVFAVRKPSHMDRAGTLSVQFFDHNGAAAFKVFLAFGGDAPTPERQAQFAAIVDRFGRTPADADSSQSAVQA